MSPHYAKLLVLQEADDLTPVLTIRLELSGSQVVFNPKLDEDDAAPSVQEYVERWIGDFLKRGDMVKPLQPGLKVRQLNVQSGFWSLFKHGYYIDNQVTKLTSSLMINQNATIAIYYLFMYLFTHSLT